MSYELYVTEDSAEAEALRTTLGRNGIEARADSRRSRYGLAYYVVVVGEWERAVEVRKGFLEALCR